MTKKITEDMVQYWLGSDDQIQEAISTLTDIANGEYKPEIFKKDVLETYNQEEES